MTLTGTKFHSIFLGYTGHALDYKLPLLRSDEKMSKECTRLLGLMNYKISGAQSNIGLEQEFFLVPRDAYARRPDLQQAGRTVLGKFPGRGQEMCDHYMAPLNPNALNCIREIQHECFKMGIPMKTRHREVAPNQYEMAPYFGNVTSQIDQNLMVIQLCEEIAAKYNLACLFQEKPFSGINGSGKHNNWSIGTKDGVNLLNAGQITAKSGNSEIFPVVMAAIVSAVDKHGDLMRAAIASPGNDFRLGAMEAPPAVMSTYLGPALTDFLTKYAAGEDVEGYTPAKMELPFGVDSIAPMAIPAEDRNRTSPFPYGGNRFEFRAAGSSQNVSMINTTLNTMTAEGMKVIADRVEAGEDAKAVAQELLKKHMKCVFNGNGYDPEWPDKAVKQDIWRIDAGVDAICELDSKKNVEFFSSMGVFSGEECEARKAIMLEHYIGVVDMELLTLKDMIMQHILPCCDAAPSCDASTTKELTAAAETLTKKAHEITALAETDLPKAAKMAYEARFGEMAAVRELCDAAEAVCKDELWTLATYKDLLFLDTHTAVTEEGAFAA